MDHSRLCQDQFLVQRGRRREGGRPGDLWETRGVEKWSHLVLLPQYRCISLSSSAIQSFNCSGEKVRGVGNWPAWARRRAARNSSDCCLSPSGHKHRKRPSAEAQCIGRCDRSAIPWPSSVACGAPKITRRRASRTLGATGPRRANASQRSGPLGVRRLAMISGSSALGEH